MTLEHELPSLFAELADDHDVAAPPPLELRAESPTPSAPRKATRTILAAAASIAVLIGGLIAVAGRTGDGDEPSNDPASETDSTAAEIATPTSTNVDIVLAPDSDPAIAATQVWSRSVTASGAIAAPDGTVYSILIVPGGRSLPDAVASATIAGFDVDAEVVDTQISRVVRDDCWSITIATTGAPFWGDDFTTLLENLHANRDVGAHDEAALTIDVPTGWESSSGGQVQRTWVMDLDVSVDDQQHDVEFVQIPNGPVDFLLQGAANPEPFDHDGRQWWVTEDVATGTTRVIGDAGLGAFAISSNLTVEQLSDIVDSFVPTPSNELPPAPEVPTEAASSLPATCGEFGAGLELVDP